MRTLFGRGETGAVLLALPLTVAAAELVTAGRTLDTVTPLTWVFISAYVFAGWTMAHLKTAVRWRQGDADFRADLIMNTVASITGGFGAAIGIITETKMGLVYCYFIGAVGAYGGKALWDIGLEALKSAVTNLARGKSNETTDG